MTIFWQTTLLQNTNNNLSANFDHKLENFGVDTDQLKEPSTDRIFALVLRIGKKKQYTSIPIW